MHPGTTLTDAVREAADLWRTPDAPGGGGPRTHTTSVGQGHQVTLDEQAGEWMTPTSRDAKGMTNENRRGPTRPDQVDTWPTPDATIMNDRTSPECFDRFRRKMKETTDAGNGHGTPLAMAAMKWDAEAGTWTTPMAGNSKRGLSPKHDAIQRARGHGRADLFTDAASLCPGPPAPAPAISGAPSSKPTPTSRPRLSPTFVEWLMGVDRGWTDPAAWIACAASATASSPSKPPPPSSSSGTASRSDA